MPDRCTCGAQLPEDARFCHKCGKPQFTELYVEPDPDPAPLELPPPPIPELPEVGFRNPLAVRIGLFLAILTFLLFFLLGPFTIIWMLVAGVVGVWLYAKRTGAPMTPIAGARLGWITGLFTFLILLAIMALMALALSDKANVDMFLAQMKQRDAEVVAQQIVETLQSPGKIFIALLSMFFSYGLLPVLGGMLGAKIFRTGSGA